jgi:hypothetical protein
MTTLLCPAISWRECVRALQRAGFRVTSGGGPSIVLMQGYRIVTVPRLKVMSEGVLQRVLQSSGLTSTELVDLVAGSSSALRVVKPIATAE